MSKIQITLSDDYMEKLRFLSKKFKINKPRDVLKFLITYVYDLKRGESEWEMKSSNY